MTNELEMFFIKGKDAEGSGFLTSDGFLVKEGSVARKDIVPSARGSVPSVHSELISAGVLVERNGQLSFMRDHLFKAPSGAAAAVLGRTANGWIEWKTEDGVTLNDAIRSIASGALEPSKRRQIIHKHQQMVTDDSLPSETQLSKHYANFRQRFGPQVLRSLEGEPLLSLMHDQSNRDSLVYWLEFKNDEEFDTRRFGSIAGGSSLKFGIFRRKETGHWQAGDRSNNPTDISVEEAVKAARLHRDQFLKGADLLDAFPQDATDDDYAQLQLQMDEHAPDVSNLAWGHKYFSMLYPDKLDDYHSGKWQRFHILKLLQMPPEGKGRYRCAGRFIGGATEVGLPVVLFDSVLNGLHGALHRYWRIGTTDGDTQKNHWQMMKDRNRIAIGWNQMGDLSWVARNKSSREKLKAKLADKHPNHATAIGRFCTQITNFVATISEGDIVWAADGAKILGVGRVVGDYEYHSEFEFPHQRGVEWVNLEEWQMPSHEGLRTTVKEIRKHDNILATERRIQLGEVPNLPNPSVTKPNRPVRLDGIQGRIQSIVERKGQVVLYGPPGTGKTYWAERTAYDLASISTYGKLFDDLDKGEKTAIAGGGQSDAIVRLSCFHPAYGYEDFIEGYRPHMVNDQVAFELRDGVFKTLCKDAEQSPERNFFLIVDEINRGDIPRIFGELLTILEKDKRGRHAILPVSQELFYVPKNVFLIGTMNTADRSISLLDAALRRRFGFVEMMPDGKVLRESSVAGIPLRAWFEALNTRIREHVGRDARNLQIGHSYLMHAGTPVKDVASLKRAVRDDIIPLLEEYCYEDYATLALILGDEIVDANQQRIRQELFDDGQESNLIQALLAPCPEISASSEAIASDESNIELDDENDEEADEE